MKALTLRHPWPYAICRLGKDVENRTWAPRGLRVGDRFAVHAGRAPRLDGDHDYWGDIGDAVIWMDDNGLLPDAPITPRKILETGASAVVATAVLREVLRREEREEAAMRRWPWFVGPVGWVLGDVVVLPTPAPCRGHQGLWELPDGVLS